MQTQNTNGALPPLTDEIVGSAPTSSTGQLQDVEFCCTIKHISCIDTAAGTFEGSVKTTFIWVDNGIDSEKEEPSGPQQTILVTDSPDSTRWRPIAKIQNTVALEKLDEVWKVQDRATGTVVLSTTYIGTFIELFEIAAFPFDCQRLHIQMKIINGSGIRIRASVGEFFSCSVPPHLH